jgi:hypothetical protein
MHGVRKQQAGGVKQSLMEGPLIMLMEQMDGIQQCSRRIGHVAISKNRADQESSALVNQNYKPMFHASNSQG